MEGRGSRGSWRRGGRGGNDGDSFSGEHRGRGRGAHHRGRGKRDYYRGRGRGAHAAADPSVPGRDEEENFEEKNETTGTFPRRKLQSNWDRYTESELPDQEDDIPTMRGTDYHALLGSAGDSFSQFRFSEEKDWEMDAFMTSQMSAVHLDLQALALCLEQIPLHERLGLEPELVQVSTPTEIPPISFISKPSKFASSAFKNVDATPTSGAAADPQVSSAAEPVDEDELDQLLGLKEADVGEEPVALDGTPDIVEEKDEVREVKPQQPAPVKEKMTEEDLEDWLDSMIS